MTTVPSPEQVAEVFGGLDICLFDFARDHTHFLARTGRSSR